MEVLSSVLVFAIAVVFVFFKDRKDKEYLEKTLQATFSSLSETSKKFYETIVHVQSEHFRQLEKQSSKQLTILQKQSRDFLKQVKESQEMILAGSIQNYYQARRPQAPKAPILIENIKDAAGEENQIEKNQDLPEFPLDEIGRVPIVDGVNLKFEDEEQIYPMDITAQQ